MSKRKNTTSVEGNDEKDKLLKVAVTAFSKVNALTCEIEDNKYIIRISKKSRKDMKRSKNTIFKLPMTTAIDNEADAIAEVEANIELYKLAVGMDGAKTWLTNK